VGDERGEVQLLDVETGAATPMGGVALGAPVRALAASPDGRALLVGGRALLHVDAATGEARPLFYSSSPEPPKPPPPMKRSVEEHLAGLRALVEGRGLTWSPPKGATDLAIDALAAATGVAIGPSLRALWRAMDGANLSLFGVEVVDQTYSLGFNSVAWAEKAWKFQQSLQQWDDDDEQHPPRDPRIAGGWYNPAWLPIADWNGEATVLFYDTAPAKGGTVGQILVYTTSPEYEMHYAADSLEEFMRVSFELVSAKADDWFEE
jgi:cell wall assembly regulator SMI1